MQAANVAAVNLVICIFIWVLDHEVAGLFKRIFPVIVNPTPAK